MRRAGTIAALLVLLLSVHVATAPLKPVYVGTRACGTCHDGQASGHQFTRWAQTKHARGWDVLKRPESVAIARLSGLRRNAWEEPICLGCHTTGYNAEEWQKDDDFRMEDGVQCETCHGPGSEYMREEVMRNREQAVHAGLRLSGKHDCLGCHIEKNSHVTVLGTKPFNLEAAWPLIAHPKQAHGRLPQPTSPATTGALSAEAEAVLAHLQNTYKSPSRLAFRPSSSELWVTLEGSGSIAILDATARKKIDEIRIGNAPCDVAFTPDGALAFVSNREDDTVSVIDASLRKVTTTLPTGDEPHGVLADREGKHLYILNTSSDDIGVYDISTLSRVKTLSAGRGPWSLAMSPDGARIAATNTYSHLTGFRKPGYSEITVMDADLGIVTERWRVPDTNLMMGIAWHPSGEFAVATMNRTKNLVPMTRLLQGWTITNGLAVLWKDGAVDQVLLDQPGLGFADATAVAMTPDGRYALVTSAGTNRVAVVNTAKLVDLARNGTAEFRRNILPNHLGQSHRFVDAYVDVGRRPRGIVVAPDGTAAFVANALDDSISVINLATLRLESEIGLDGPATITKVRRGEQLFHSAAITFRRQFSCASCHPDGHVDGLSYDIEADGIGVSPVDNRTLRGINDTGPFKWEGTNPSLSRQCGARLSIFFTRIQPFTPDELSALDLYITTIARPPNRYWEPGVPLTPAQRRGKALFERQETVTGRPIPRENQCVTCHMPPYYTNRQKTDVGSKHASDRQGIFDVPHLNNIYDSAPYLHNGIAHTLEEIWTVHNPYDTHGVTNDLTKDQLNDLIEYLKTL
ncbi:MAG: beta-propeller fold lactonase family protein [Bryobacterales bacterium]|nr:beta-propeller fold lactonase family protein [Bryobacterales bacterium]